MNPSLNTKPNNPQYETYIPRKFILDDGKVIQLTTKEIKEKLTKETLFQLYVPPEHTEEIYKTLKLQGFTKPELYLPKGEKYSLAKELYKPWELHIRIYENGFIESEIEISREYIQHLGNYRINVVYEAFNYYKETYNMLHIFYKPQRKWIIKIEDNFHVKIAPPKLLIPWKPIVAGIAIITTIGFITHTLSKPKDF